MYITNSYHFNILTVIQTKSYTKKITSICDPLNENLALPCKYLIRVRGCLSKQVIFQLDSDYYTHVLQEACTISY